MLASSLLPNRPCHIASAETYVSRLMASVHGLVTLVLWACNGDSSLRAGKQKGGGRVRPYCPFTSSQWPEALPPAPPLKV